MAEIIAQRTFTVSRAPKDGKPGDKGEDALTLVVTPNTFVFQTNDKGNIENLAQNKGKVRMYLGKMEVVPSSIEITPYNCYARIVGDNTLHFDGISPNQWSGKVEVTATYKGQTRTAIAEFMVSAQKWNEAKFLANDQQFQSIIAQNKADKQGLERRMSTIEQDAEKIRLEVSKQTFGGVNMLKGASLRPLNLLLLQRAQYVTIGNYASVAHLDNPYLAIVRHGAPQNEWNGCKFPVIKALGGRTYTLSMFTRIYGSEQPYIEIKRSRSKDMTAPKTSYPNIPSSYGIWKQYSYSFDMEDGYNYVQIFIGYTRDGEAYLSEIQLEEGTKATAWKDPDIVDSVERTGIDLTNGTVSVEAANFEIKHNGEKPFVVSKGKALLGGWVFDKGILFSQCGDINGSPSTDYGNTNFNPDIVLDPINGYMSGVGSFRKKMLVVTQQNIAKYAKIDPDIGYVFMAGKISAIALFKGAFDRTIFITLPGVAGDADFEIARTLIGETIAIYNQTTSYINIWGSGTTISVYPNNFAALEVKISVNPQTGKESYYNIDWIRGKMLI
jgi:conserved domain protein